MLKELRESKGITQRQLAEKIGISYSMVQKLESGKRKAGLQIALKLAKFYRKPLSALFLS